MALIVPGGSAVAGGHRPTAPALVTRNGQHTRVPADQGTFGPGGGQALPHGLRHVRGTPRDVFPGVLEDANTHVLEFVASLCVAGALTRRGVTTTTGHFDDDRQLSIEEIDPSNGALVRPEHHLRQWTRKPGCPHQFQEPSLEHGVSAGVEQHTVEQAASPASRTAQLRQTPLDDQWRRCPCAYCRLDRRLQPRLRSSRHREIDDGASGAGRPEPADCDAICSRPVLRRVHGLLEANLTPRSSDRELDAVSGRPIEAVQLGGGFVADARVATETE